MTTNQAQPKWAPPLIELLGSSPQLRLFQFLWAHREFRYSVQELCRDTHMSRQTVSSALKPLVHYGLLVVEPVGNARTYRIYESSEAVKGLAQIHQSCLRIIIRDQKGKKVPPGKMEDFLKELDLMKK